MTQHIAIGDIVKEVTELQQRVGLIHLHPEYYGINRAAYNNEADAANFTSDVDIAVEKVLKPALLKLIPGSGFLGEETEGVHGLDFEWIVDPTDATAVFETGGHYYSNSIALRQNSANDGKGAVLFGSVYQPALKRQFVRTPYGLEIKELIKEPCRGGFFNHLRTSHPFPSQSEGFAEWLGCSFGTSKYYKENPGVKEALENVFSKTEVSSIGRSYSPIDARPASGSSAAFCCDIGAGNRHFALLFYQKAWDLAVGAMYAKDAGCPIVLFDNKGNELLHENLEHAIAQCDKKTLINVGVFANPTVKDYVLTKFNEGLQLHR